MSLTPQSSRERILTTNHRSECVGETGKRGAPASCIPLLRPLLASSKLMVYLFFQARPFPSGACGFAASLPKPMSRIALVVCLSVASPWAGT